LLPAPMPLSANRTVSWVWPLATFVNGEKVVGLEQVASQRANAAPLLRKLWKSKYIWIST
jgi:hypothetical protein